jgi:hypothetical protein
LEDKGFSFICCYNDEDILNKYLSPSLQKIKHDEDEIILLEGFEQQSVAYIKGEQLAKKDILVYLHQDVSFSGDWRDRLVSAIADIDDWGVLGAVGIRLEIDEKKKICDAIQYGHAWDKDTTWDFRVDELPARVDAIDSVVCVKKRGVLAFDPNHPGFHGAVEDLCQTSKKEGKGVWVADLYLKHHTRKVVDPVALKESMQYSVGKWKQIPYIYGNVVWT